MRVEFASKLASKKTEIKTQNTNFQSKVELFFASKTLPLKNDSFEKNNQEQKEQVEQTERLVPRKYPNWCEYDEDYRSIPSVPAQTICYYPEDVEKMEQMTDDEIVAYKRKLRKEGKYTYAPLLSEEEFIADMHRYGIDIEKYLKNRDKI